MPHRFKLIQMPASREPVSLLAVDRCVSELRRGRMVCVRGGGGVSALVQAAEAVTDDGLEKLKTVAQQQPVLAITLRRALILSLIDAADQKSPAIALSCAKGWQAEAVLELADPLSNFDFEKGHSGDLDVKSAKTYGCAAAAIGLAKIARLLPAAMVAEISDPDAEDVDAWAIRHGLLVVDAGDVFQYEHTQARTLKAVSEASVPLLDSQDARIIAFRPDDGGLEHLAIIIGAPDDKRPVLTRLHSECFTGDLLGSLRCDCGDQLRGAINEIASAGGGVLLYLAQEGRGIGLVNKLRAYELQDRGFDTMDANEQLGFDADERIYLPAAEMLNQLGFSSVRLLTNNPAKIEALSACGVEIVERVEHAFPANQHNEQYLKTKAARGGHLI
ncbi:MAG: GTP cyclohydrolase II [Rhodospirillaceae bacterium]|jgi:GTP cyclohydrolase II|nr:GTP cyclohydrolase II [Rhodospirillaceae bacterium]MBT5242962.1 GTP cyclohydrolase II [Rhodospirillaceae bacterium]MBT5563186.1 GTP cyclohydrolase II [Rhodospirillaceae bacterium]MBT6243501.1 GTP cyclohydrolase II [Rhodospirillaceae bacterium]MBT7137528.1 GTP cyclohydrolase II [Rhodospirillaceae bacterium]